MSSLQIHFIHLSFYVSFHFLINKSGSAIVVEGRCHYPLRITLNWPENSFTAQLTKQDKRGDHSARHISFPLWKYLRLWKAPEKNEMEEKNNKCDRRQNHISPDDEIKLFDASPMSNPIYGWSARRPRWICRCPISRPNALSSTPPTLFSPPHYVKILRNDLILKFCW